MADGVVEAIFHYRRPFTMRFSGADAVAQPVSLLVSQINRYVEIQPAGAGGFVSVRFHPWGAHHFLPVPMREVGDRATPADEVWPRRDVREVEERVAAAATDEDRIGALQDRYLLSRNRSIFPPQDGLPDGDDHEDWTVVSYDDDRDTYVLRQFNSEGFVNTFVLDDASTPPEHMVFVLEASENARGTQATLTVTRTDADSFEEVFDLTLPGATDSITIRGRWTRAAP